MSAACVELIGLLETDAETSVFMMLCCHRAYEQAKREDRLQTVQQLGNTIVPGATKRTRPKFMTFASSISGYWFRQERSTALSVGGDAEVDPYAGDTVLRNP
jgi:hypothetical protein